MFRHDLSSLAKRPPPVELGIEKRNSETGNGSVRRQAVELDRGKPGPLHCRSVTAT